MQGAGYLPELFAEFGSCLDQFQAFEGAVDHRHGQRFGEHLRAQVVAQEVDHLLGAGDEAADSGHRLGECAECEVDLVHHAKVFGRAASVGTHGAKAVSVVDQKTEVEFFFQGSNLVERAKVAGHAEHAFGDYEDAAFARLLCQVFLGHHKHLAALFDVVVREDEALAAFGFVHEDAVHDAGVSL